MKNTILIIVSSVITLILGEIILKVFLPLSLPNNHSKIFCQYDSLLGWSKIPYHEGYHITNEYQVKENFNSKGLRGPEYPYKKKNSEKRILILGDSFAEGYMVEFDNLFSEVLKRNLNYFGFSDYTFEVINAGTGGYSTDQEYLYFKYEGYKYDPDLVILMFCNNDAYYNNQASSWRGHKPLFRLLDDNIIQDVAIVPKPQEEKITRRIKTWFEKNIELYKRIKKVKDKLIYILRKDDKKLPTDFKLYNRNQTDNVIEAWNITEKLLAEIKSICDTIGSKLIIFHIPPYEAVYNDVWNNMKKYYNFSDEKYSVDIPRQRLEQICKNRQLDYLNPFMDLKRSADSLLLQNERIYYETDNHWNTKGNQLVGEILTNYIIPLIK